MERFSSCFSHTKMNIIEIQRYIQLHQEESSKFLILPASCPSEPQQTLVLKMNGLITYTTRKAIMNPQRNSTVYKNNIQDR